MKKSTIYTIYEWLWHEVDSGLSSNCGWTSCECRCGPMCMCDHIPTLPLTVIVVSCHSDLMGQRPRSIVNFSCFMQGRAFVMMSVGISFVGRYLKVTSFSSTCSQV